MTTKDWTVTFEGEGQFPFVSFHVSIEANADTRDDAITEAGEIIRRRWGWHILDHYESVHVSEGWAGIDDNGENDERLS